MITQTVRDALYAMNLGAGSMPCATEIIIHCTNIFRNKFIKDKSGCIAKIDWTNCYNRIFRIFMRKSITTFIPRILPHFDTLHGHHSPLFAGNNGDIIWSRTGSQQGCSISCIL